MIRTSTSLLLLAWLGLTSCSSGPDYQRPAAPTASVWKEGSGWRVATPAELAERGPWWTAFHDDELNALVAQVAVSNQNLQAAEAAWRAASAVIEGSKSGYLPTVGADVGAQRNGTNNSSQNKFTAEGSVSWTPDVWGRIRRTVESDEAAAQASGADLLAATLSAQASLVTLYLRICALDEQRRLLDEITAADERALNITQRQFEAGLVSRVDVLLAETQLASVRSQTVGLGVARAQSEHAIAVLIGKPPSALTITTRSGLPLLPDVPLTVPSALLERRPDIAAAERRVASANALIGAAQAAYYPDLTLSGVAGFAGAAAGSLIQASNLVWSVGAQASATLFDGGARDAKVSQATANWQQTVANYRQTVLLAFQQTEDQLTAIHILAEQAQVQQQAVTSSSEAERISFNQYQSGIIGYANVILTQNNTRSNRLTALQIEADRRAAAVALITALGGGWSAEQLPTVPPAP